MLGSGTAIDPYQVATASDLNNVRNNLSAYYIQMADIDLSGYVNWIPIGLNSDYSFNSAFSGSYDGQNYTISGLTISHSGNNSYLGLFSVISSTCILKNCRLLNAMITCNVDIYNTSGSLIGVLAGQTRRLFGETGYSQITNCHASGNVEGHSGIGVLVGEATYSIIDKCSTTGSAEAIINAGGLIGQGSYLTITECFSNAHAVTYIYSNAGSFIGYCSVSSISNCFATGNSTGGYAGGFIGYVYNMTIINCYSTGIPVGNSQSGGFVARIAGSNTYTSCYYDLETSGQSDTGTAIPKTTEEMKTQLTFVDWDFNTIWGINLLTNDGYPYFLWTITSQIAQCIQIKPMFSKFNICTTL